MAQGSNKKSNRNPFEKSTGNAHIKSSRNLWGNAEAVVSYDTNGVISDETSSRKILAIENVRNYFNEHLFIEVFGNSLGPAMIRPAKRGKAFGFYRKAAWKEESQTPVPEISICPSGMHRSPDKVFSMLVHELTHQYQDEYGNPGRPGYHNQEFSQIMDEIGLICSNTGESGGRQTGDQMTHYIDPDGLYAKVFAAMPKEYLLPFKPLFDRGDYAPGAPQGADGMPKQILIKNKQNSLAWVAEPLPGASQA